MDSTVWEFVTKMEWNKWSSSGHYSVNKNRRFTRFTTSMLRSDLFDPYIVVKGTITVEGDTDAKIRYKKLAFKNNATFRSCKSIKNLFIDNKEDLDMVIAMYNLLESSDDYSVTSRSLWNYYRDEINDDVNENNVANNRINNSQTVTSKSFEYKTKLIGSMPSNNNT